MISERGRHWKRTLRARRHVERNLNAAPTLSGLRVFRVGGVCLLEVVAGPERGQDANSQFHNRRAKKTRPSYLE